MLKMPEKIEGERVVLVRPYPATFELAKEIFEKIDLSRKTLRVWLSWVDGVKRPEDRFPWLVNQVQTWNKCEGFAYLVRDKKTNVLLGCVDLADCSEKHKTAEIGYWLSDDAVGQGYMTEAVYTLESMAFKKGFNRITIRNDSKNIRSDNIPKRCGYHMEGVSRSLKWSDQWHSFRDINVWSKLKTDWKKQQPKQKEVRHVKNARKN